MKTRPKPAYGWQGLVAGLWGQDTVQTGTFWGVLNISLCTDWIFSSVVLSRVPQLTCICMSLSLPGASRLGTRIVVLTGPLVEVKIFGVSQGVLTDPLEEVIVFGAFMKR